MNFRLYNFDQGLFKEHKLICSTIKLDFTKRVERQVCLNTIQYILHNQLPLDQFLLCLEIVLSTVFVCGALVTVSTYVEHEVSWNFVRLRFHYCWVDGGVQSIPEKRSYRLKFSRQIKKILSMYLLSLNRSIFKTGCVSRNLTCNSLHFNFIDP